MEHLSKAFGAVQDPLDDLEGLQHLDLVVPFEAAGLRASRPIRQHGVERLDLHHQLVPLGERELGFRTTRRRHLGKLRTPVRDLLGAHRVAGHVADVAGHRNQVFRIRIQLRDDHRHLRVGIELHLDVHGCGAMLERRADQPLGVLAVADPARDPLEEEILAPRRELGDLVLSLQASGSCKAKEHQVNS